MSWRQSLRLLPLRCTVSLADLIARLLGPRRPTPRRLPAWRPGIAVLIPECGTPATLATTLAALDVARRSIAEPVQVHVLVNGAPRADYDALMQRHPSIDWHFEPA